MRSLEAIRVLQCSGAVAALLLTGSVTARAQFAGGIGDGYARDGRQYLQLDATLLASPAYTGTAAGGDGYSQSGRAFIALDGSIAPPPQLYTATATGGDGYSESGRLNISIDGAAPPRQVFTASASGGDGYATAGMINRAIDGAAVFVASFKGGIGDGYDSQNFENQSIDPNAASFVIYRGGIGDGYDEDGLAHTGLGGSDLPEAVFTASPSGGDGYDFNGLGFQPLDGNAIPGALFLGSAAGGDGYDQEGVAFVPVNGAEDTVFAFLGNTGDGYSSAASTNWPFDTTLLPPIAMFAGDTGDGYDTRSLPFVQYLGGGEAASPVTFANWLSSRFSGEEIGARLSAAHADPDNDGLPNLLEFALGSDPREPDATAFSPEFRLSNLADLGFPALADHHLTAIVRRNPLALDATLRIEIADDPGSLWSVNETVIVDSVPSAFIVRDQFGMKSATRRVMRLRATLNP